MLRHGASGAFRSLAKTILLSISLSTAAVASVPWAVYNAVFEPDQAIDVTANISITCPGDTLLAVYPGSMDGRYVATPFRIDGDRVAFSSGSDPIARIFVLIRGDGFKSTPGQRTVSINEVPVSGQWDDSGGIILGQLADVTDSLSFATVGFADTHRVGFNTTTTPLSDSGIIWITLPQDFAIGAISDTAYYDDDPFNDGDEPVITSVTVVDQTIKFQLNQGAQQAGAGFRISILFATVVSDTVAGDYAVVVQTTDADGYIDNGPAVSEPFTLSPDALDHISILPDGDLTVPSDSIVNFDVTGYDQYENDISGLIFTYGVTVDSCGEAQDGTFRAIKVGECYFTAAADGVIDSSGLLTVVPGPLDRFFLSGYPSATDAGIPFLFPINVTVYDVNDNVKTDYTGSVWFTSDDPAATLPYVSGSPYDFNIGDAGSHNFAGSGFILRTAGLRTITVTDGILSTVSTPINVIPGIIVSFDLNAESPQIAGESFLLQASSAVDSLGKDYRS
jgi:hypothetical protein